MEHFTKAIVEIGYLLDDGLLLATNSTVCEGTHFAFSINKIPPRTYSDFLERAKYYVNLEALTFERDRWKRRKHPAESYCGSFKPYGGSRRTVLQNFALSVVL